VLLTGPYLSTRYVNRALSEFALHPGAASRDLDRAASLDPLSSAPMVTRGLIDEQLHEPAAARAAFAAALRRERGWFPRFEIALLDAQAGRFGSARADLAQVAALDSADPLVAEAGRLVARRDRIDPLRFNELLLRGPQSSFFERQNIK
jgi:hypothetical protein